MDKTNIVSYGGDLEHHLKQAEHEIVLGRLVEMISNDMINQGVRCQVAYEAVRIAQLLVDNQVIENLRAMSSNNLINQEICNKINNAFMEFRFDNPINN